MSFLKRFIPAQYHYRLAQLKNMFAGYRQMHYSQFGEDIILAKLFANQKTGRYVDVGAHHPARYSNTKLLFDKGWSGINIDPNPHTKKLFNRARPHDTNILCGVGQEGVKTYYQFSDPALNTFSQAEAGKWMDKTWVTYLGTTTVPIHPLASLVAGEVDVLNIDAEGMDLEVLQTNDWEQCKPKVIVVEASSGELVPFLEAKGYRLEAHMGKALIFVTIAGPLGL